MRTTEVQWTTMTHYALLDDRTATVARRALFEEVAAHGMSINVKEDALTDEEEEKRYFLQAETSNTYLSPGLLSAFAEAGYALHYVGESDDKANTHVWNINTGQLELEDLMEAEA